MGVISLTMIRVDWICKGNGEAYQSILSYVINSVRIDVDDPGIKRLYIQAARVPKFSIEYSCEDIALIMPEIEKAVLTWKKENAEESFFVDGGENWWMVKNKVGTFTYTTNRLFMNMCEIKGILELVKDAIDKYRVIMPWIIFCLGVLWHMTNSGISYRLITRLTAARVTSCLLWTTFYLSWQRNIGKQSGYIWVQARKKVPWKTSLL